MTQLILAILLKISNKGKTKKISNWFDELNISLWCIDKFGNLLALNEVTWCTNTMLSSDFSLHLIVVDSKVVKVVDFLFPPFYFLSVQRTWPNLAWIVFVVSVAFVPAELVRFLSPRSWCIRRIQALHDGTSVENTKGKIFMMLKGRNTFVFINEPAAKRCPTIVKSSGWVLKGTSSNQVGRVKREANVP